MLQVLAKNRKELCKKPNEILSQRSIKLINNISVCELIRNQKPSYQSMEQVTNVLIGNLDSIKSPTHLISMNKRQKILFSFHEDAKQSTWKTGKF